MHHPSHLRHLQIESHIDIAASNEENRQARAHDSAKLDSILRGFAENSRNIKTLLSAHLTRDAEMIEIKDLLHLCVRRLDGAEPGKPETLFYNATFNTMTRLSGGRVDPAPDWIVSPLEVDFEEGTDVCLIHYAVLKLRTNRNRRWSLQ